MITILARAVTVDEFHEQAAFILLDVMILDANIGRSIREAIFLHEVHELLEVSKIHLRLILF